MNDKIDEVTWAELHARGMQKWQDVINQREEILSAFIAKYGLQPDEIIQVEGPGFWFVRRMTEEEMK